MLVIFFALSAAVALIIDRNIWVRLLILASAIPIALISNIARITITGMAYQLASPELAESLFHDWAGWLMMPFGLLMLWGELWLLSHLFIEDSDDDYDSLAMGFSKTATAANSNNGGTESDAKGSGKIHLPLP
jgi:exosortase/archaeosortase family protein